MKKTLLLLSLSLLFMYQCKKENKDIVDNNNNNNKNVRVYCEIPMNSNGKSDFTNIFEGSVSWSSGSESVFLAVPGDKLIQLTTEGIEGNPNSLYFETYVCEGEITAGDYDLWYLGNSMHREEEGEEEKGITPNVTINTNNETGVITSIDGSIAEQSGDLKDVGRFHIAKAKVSAAEDSDGDIVLNLETTMENQMSLAYLDLSGPLSDQVLTLTGGAITASAYTLTPDGFNLNLNVNKEISISKTDTTAQFVVLLPNKNDDVVLNCGYLGGHTFKKGIEAGKFYYRKISELQNEPLTLDVNAKPTLGDHDISLIFRSGCTGVTVSLIHDGGAKTVYGAIYSDNMAIEDLTLDNCTGKIECEEYTVLAEIPNMEFNKRYKVRTYATNKEGTVYTDVEEIQYIEYVNMGTGVSISTLNIEADNYFESGDTYKWGVLDNNDTPWEMDATNIHQTLSTEYDIAYQQLSARLPLAEHFTALNDSKVYQRIPEYDSDDNIIGHTFTNNETNKSIYLKVGTYWTRKAYSNTHAYFVSVNNEADDNGNYITSGYTVKTNIAIIRPVK